jgi:hypothetical protein
MMLSLDFRIKLTKHMKVVAGKVTAKASTMERMNVIGDRHGKVLHTEILSKSQDCWRDKMVETEKAYSALQILGPESTRRYKSK